MKKPFGRVEQKRGGAPSFGQYRGTRGRTDRTETKDSPEARGGRTGGPVRYDRGESSPTENRERPAHAERVEGRDRPERRSRPSFGGRSERGGRDSRSSRREGRPQFAKPSRATSGKPRHEVAEETQISEDIVRGRHPVIEALKAGRPINKIVIAEGAEGGSLTEVIGKAKAANVMIQTAPRAHLTKTAGPGHQGVMAYVAPHEYAELEDIVQRQTGHAPLVVLMDEVTDPHNLGAILRTAEATGVQGVIIPKHRAVPLTGVVAKASAGALEHMPVARVTNLVQTMERLKDLGYWIVGTAVEGETSYTSANMTGNVAIVIGSEGKGLSRLVQEKCDFLVSLPMLGTLQSLNASVAAGVLLYEVVRQRS
jgi:23S rRNA (guanosine2251-2'-O)-methyltransferase